MILLNLPLLHHLFPQKSCSNLVFVQVIMNWITCLAFLIKQLMVSVVLSWKFLGHGQWVSFSVLGGQEILQKKGTIQLFAYCLLCWKYARTVSKLFFNYYSLEFQGLSVENLIERICFHWMKKYWGAGETGKKRTKHQKPPNRSLGYFPPQVGATQRTYGSVVVLLEALHAGAGCPLGFELTIAEHVPLLSQAILDSQVPVMINKELIRYL